MKATVLALALGAAAIVMADAALETALALPRIAADAQERAAW